MKGSAMSNLIVVTDFEKVPEDDFYLSDEWAENCSIDNIVELREMAKEGELFIAYVVDAKIYAIYHQMDASQIFIDFDNNEVMSCESAIIGNKHEDVWECDY